MKNSLLINLFLFSLCLLFAACGATHNASTIEDNQLLDKGKTSRYQLLIKVNQSEITGIMLLKYMSDEWRGSVMNEFGVKVFDLKATKGKCRLQHVIPLLDKWAIRRTIASDFAFLFWNAGQGKPDKGKSMERLPDGAFLLKNEKHHITYLFQPVKE
jgi:hypothetical protein